MLRLAQHFSSKNMEEVFCMAGKKKGAMYPLKVLGNAVGWVVVFGLVRWAIKNKFSQKNNLR